MTPNLFTVQRIPLPYTICSHGRNNNMTSPQSSPVSPRPRPGVSQPSVNFSRIISYAMNLSDLWPWRLKTHVLISHNAPPSLSTPGIVLTIILIWMIPVIVNCELLELYYACILFSIFCGAFLCKLFPHTDAKHREKSASWLLSI